EGAALLLASGEVDRRVHAAGEAEHDEDVGQQAAEQLAELLALAGDVVALDLDRVDDRGIEAEGAQAGVEERGLVAGDRRLEAVARDVEVVARLVKQLDDGRAAGAERLGVADRDDDG